jgi:hypothetical protein
MNGSFLGFGLKDFKMKVVAWWDMMHGYGEREGNEEEEEEEILEF